MKIVGQRVKRNDSTIFQVSDVTVFLEVGDSEMQYCNETETVTPANKTGKMKLQLAIGT